ncbi:hypothetical protein BRC94_06090 [Halobacteriales archaeon QS_5_70_17]|nr:MAG: hypothetical protein BRC94_06090 [Halobacteriales archaeon QS_5_70_17]
MATALSALVPAAGALQAGGGTGALTALPPFVYVLAAALVVSLLSRRAGHALGIVATLAVLGVSLAVPAGTYLPVRLFGFEAALFNVDAFSRLMGIIFGFIGAVAILYSYASDADNVQTAFAMSYVGTSVGAVYAGDWLTLVFFWELMAVTSTALVWYYGGEAVRAGLRYALLHGIGGSLVLAAVLPVATGNFVRTGRIGAGFDFGVLRTLVTNRTMLVAVLYAFVVNILLSVVANVLGFTIVGFLAVPFVAFVAQSAIFYIWADGFADAYEAEYGQRPTAPDGPLKPGVTVGEDGSDETTGTPGEMMDLSDNSDDRNEGSDDDRRWE